MDINRNFNIIQDENDYIGLPVLSETEMLESIKMFEKLCGENPLDDSKRILQNMWDDFYKYYPK